jgi:hypothetical protein
MISGTVAAGDAAIGTTVTLFDTFDGVATQIGTAAVVGGSWSTSVTLSGYGNHSIVADDTDAAGNTGASTPVTFALALETVPSGGTLSLRGDPSVTVDFQGAGGNLVLVPPGITGTINAVSTAAGPVSIGGAGSVITSSGDAIDLTASGGTQSNPADLVVSPTGSITGAATSIDVIQNGFGDVVVATSGPVLGQAGRGIFAEESASGVGSVVVDGSGNVTGFGAAYSGIVAEILNVADTGLNAGDPPNVTVDQTGNITGGYDGIHALTEGNGNVTVLTGPNALISGGQNVGIEAASSGTGSILVTTATNDTITSPSSGINAYNQANSITLAAASTIIVNAYGTIDSGALLTGQGNQPAGILAGYEGGATNTKNSNVFGSVTVNDYASIVAAGGDGIRGFNYGVGNITITDEPNTTIIAPGEYGIRETNYGSGNESITTSSGDSIASGASGISAANDATAIASSAGSSISVVAYGAINSGTNLNSSGSQPQAISAGYYGSNGTPNNAINGTVSIDNFANITAAAGKGVNAYNYGNGPVTLTDESGTTVSGAQYGIGAYSLSYGPTTATTNAATPTTSATLSFASTPSWIVAGMPVVDVTTNKTIGTVLSTTGTTVTLTADAANRVGSGDVLSFPETATTNGATPTRSPTLSFASTPSWIVAGLAVVDVTTGKTIGTVSSTTSTMVTLTTNAANAVGSGDTLSFPETATTNATTPTTSPTLSFASTPSWIVAGMTVYDTTTGEAIGAVSSTTGTTATLTANAANAVGAGDTLSFGTVDVNVLSGATITAGSLYGLYGIQAGTYNASNISVTTSTGDIVNSGGLGINAYSFATSAPSSSVIAVAANGTINSSFDLNPGGGQPGGIVAGYNNGGANIVSSAIAGSVIIDSFATINAAAGDGDEIYNFGVGNVSLTLESTSAINAPLQAVSAFAQGGGNVTIVNKGTITSASGIGISVGTGNGLTTISSGTISVTNSGTMTASGSSYNAVVQINNDSTQGATFTNTGSIVANLYSAGSSQSLAVSDYNSSVVGDNGAITINNSGTISGNVNLGWPQTSASTFNNQVGGIWNIYGRNYFNGAGAITNSGTINLAGSSDLYGAAISNSGMINVAAMGAAFIGGAVSGTGTFNIGDGASLELASSVASGQTVSFGGNTGALTLDNPSGLSGSIAGLAVGDIITLQGTTISGAGVSGSTLTVTQSGSPSLTYSVSGTLSQETFSVLSGNIIVLVPTTGTVLTGALASQSYAPTTAHFYQLSGAAISSGTSTGLNITTSDSSSADTIFAEINQQSSISVTGASTGMDVTTAGANIAVISAGNISSTGGIGLLTNSGAGSTTIVDYGNVNGTVGIEAVTGGTTTTSAATATSNTTLSFTSTPPWVMAGSTVYDETTGKSVGAVLSTTGTTVTLTANAANAVGSGDTLSFGAPTAITNAATPTSSNALSFVSTPSWIVPGTSVYDATTGKSVGTVSSTTTTTTTLTLAENAVNAVGSGDTLLFTGPLSIIVGGAATISGGPTSTTSAPTATTSNTLSFGSTLSWVAAGMTVYDATIGKIIGMVSSTTGTTVSLTANAANAVGNGDMLSFLASSSTGIYASTGSGSASVTTGGGVNIDAGDSGIFVRNVGKLVPPSSLTVEAAGTITSGLVSGSNPAAINVGYLGGTSAPSSIPNPPLSGIFGNVTVDSTATITANTGTGINAFTYGTGNVTVSNSGAITATAAGNTNGTANPTTGLYNPTTAQYGINSQNFGGGNVTVADAQNATITSGSDGIFAVNSAVGSGAAPLGTQATPVTVTVVALGAITSGANLQDGGNAPAGIVAGFDSNSILGYNSFVYGNVLVAAAGSSIDAQAGNGIRAFNHGQGNVAILLNNETITAQNTPTGASGNLSPYGVGANAYGPGDLTVTTLGSDSITSGSSGINANNQATAIAVTANAVVAVNAAGAISTGNIQTGSGSSPSGISAGFYNGGPSSLDINGTVVVNSSATITVAGGRGIVAYSYGNGDVTANDSGNVTVNGDNITASSTATTTYQVSEYGIQASSISEGTGDVAINVYSGVISATSTITAITNGATSTSSAMLDFASTPSSIVSGMTVYDTTSGQTIGTVSSTTGTTITLTANAANPVASSDALSFLDTETASAATSTSSSTLNFAVTPAWVEAGMAVYDVTTGHTIGTVSSTTGTTVTLTANAASEVASGDTLSLTFQVYGVFASSSDPGNISVITNSGSSITSSGVGIDAVNQASLVATLTATTATATPTSSSTLNFASTPAWVVAGMPVYDATTGKIIGTVASATGTTVTLTANAANAVGLGDTLSFPSTTTTTSAATATSSPTLTLASAAPWIVGGMPVYDVTTGKSIGTVSSTTDTSVTLTANAANAVASGDTLSFAPVVTTNAATSSPTLSFASTPSWVVAGMTVYDATEGQILGTVSSTTTTAVTLTGNAAHAVGSGDALSFSETATTSAATSTSSPTLTFALTPSWVVAGMIAYDATTGRSIGTVSATTGTTVTLASNAASGVASGDTLAFAESSIVVTSSSTINSGTVLTGTDKPPAGIAAGYLGGSFLPTTSPLTGVDGDVTVNNFGNITAGAGDGIRAFTFGIGNVTVNEDAGTITALGGSSPTPGFGDGINAYNLGPGNILVTTATGVVINSGSSGISALNYAPSTGSSLTVPATSDVTVIAHGSIISGTTPTPSGHPAAGILAGYEPGVWSTNVDAVNGNVAGSVLIDDYASITAAIGTDGIRGVNYGTGSVTIITELGADITGGRYGIGGFAYDGGDVSVTNDAYVTGSTAAIDATSTATGTVFIDNCGMIAGDVVVGSGDATFHNEVGAVWELAGSSTFAATTTLINDGIIDTAGVSSITTSSVLTLVNSGVLEVQSGSLDVGAPVTGSGTFRIDGGGLLELPGRSLLGRLSPLMVRRPR